LPICDSTATRAARHSPGGIRPMRPWSICRADAGATYSPQPGGGLMRHWLVIDLEATTDEGGWPLQEMEIIEIGASLATRDGREVAHFQRYVRPVRRPCLTSFCKALTHIEQARIDRAGTLAQLWPTFEAWLRDQGSRLAGWASWGDYDRCQLEQE